MLTTSRRNPAQPSGGRERRERDEREQSLNVTILDSGVSVLVYDLRMAPSTRMQNVVWYLY